MPLLANIVKCAHVIHWRKTALKTRSLLRLILIVYFQLYICGCETDGLSIAEKRVNPDGIGCYAIPEFSFRKSSLPLGIHVAYQDNRGWWRVEHQFSDKDGCFEFDLPTPICVKCVDRPLGEFMDELRGKFQQLYPHSLVLPCFFDESTCPWCRQFSGLTTHTNACQKGQGF